MDQNTAWNSFKHTGNIMDYLIYSQLRQMDEKQPREDADEDRRRRFGYHGEMRG